VLAPEHLVSSLAQSRLFGQLDQESQRFVGDPLFRIIEVDTFGLRAKSLAASGVVREEGSQGSRFERREVRFERQPGASFT
jgi:hypothetical protein